MSSCRSLKEERVKQKQLEVVAEEITDLVLFISSLKISQLVNYKAMMNKNYLSHYSLAANAGENFLTP